MSTLSLRKIKHDSSAVDNITLGSTGRVSIKSPNADGLVLETDTADSTCSTRIFAKNNTYTGGMYYDDTGWNITTGSTVGSSTGAPKLNITRDGFVKTPYQPSFSSGFSTSYTHPSGVNVVQFNYKNFDVGTNFNTSTYRFTAPVAGKYLMSAFVGTGGAAAANAYFGISFSVNGSNAGLCWSLSASGYQKDAISQILNLNANDFVSITMEVQNSVSLTVGNFSGHLIG